MEQDFYVYTHKRKDTGAIFYVGKGKDKRSHSKRNRNTHWYNITNKAKGFDVDIVYTTNDEELVFLIEEELISVLKSRGVGLCNILAGGNGPSGYKHTEETKQIMREKASNRPGSFTGFSHTLEAKQKMREKALGKPSNFKGRKHNEKSKQSMREARLGKPGHKHTEEHKRHMSSLMTGKKRPASVGLNISRAVAGKPRSTQWINDGLNNKMIRTWDDIPQGWIKGRLINIRNSQKGTKA